MKIKKFYPKSEHAVYYLILAFFLLIWLICMYCVTTVKAEHEADEYLEENRYRASTIADICFEYWLERDDVTENYAYSKFWEAVSSTGVYSNGQPVINGTSGFFDFDNYDYTYAANAIFDSDGNIIVSSAEDYFYFEYLTEEQWNNEEERIGIYARAVFDRELLNEEGELLSKDIHHKARAMRFTGTFDGTEFAPVKIECIAEDDFWDALNKKGNGSYTIPGVIKAYDLQWITIYENPNAVSEDDKLVTLYSDWFDACYPETSPAFKYNGNKFGNLNELLAEIGLSLSGGNQNLTRYEGLDLIMISADYCETIDGETYFDSYYYGDAVTYEEGIEHEMHFYLVSAVYCSPWKTAMRELVHLYSYTFFYFVSLITILYHILKKQLILPMQRIGDALSNNLPILENENYKWREARMLYDGYTNVADICRLRKNEITRLNTALDYAKTAEQNRRQMTSNIAHELKTPLAIIHSYAEGLKEQIAEDKRDKYLDVILSESERMDAMVLEMLDLSRLEAGKVKLSVDTFSLINLTVSIFNKLSIAAEAKNLTISYDFPDECMITADEARISQVIENFVTNAIKYTPAHGNIHVKISLRRNTTTFSIENDSPPLSPDALSKVWDTFYRTDESRSGGGTGLGLAIAKSIIELHGGSCFVQNTKTGVQFSFTLK